MKSRSILCFLLAVASSIHAQNLSESITISAVEVPVYVTRVTGAPVEGLTKDDFELFVNGKPHPIDYFDVIDETTVAAATPAPAEAPRDLRRRKLSLLLFDPMNSTAFAIQNAKEKAQAFIDSAPAGDTFGVAVARYNRIEFVVPFTSDRIAVKRAVATLRASQSGDALNLATLDRERMAWAGPMLPDPGRQRADSDDAREAEPSVEDEDSLWVASNMASYSVLQDARKDEAKVYGALRLGETENWLRILGDLADRLAPLEGAKHVVLLREGGPTEEFAFTISSTHAKFRRAGVVLDAVDIGGLRASWGRSASDGTEFLRGLAVPTGGTVTTTFDSLRELQKLTYVLGFSPPRSDRRWNTIDVRLRNKPLGTHVRHRLGYSTNAPREKASDGLLLADAILNDIPQNGMTVGVRTETSGVDTTLIAQVPGVEVLALGNDGATTMDAFLYVFDQANAVVAWTQVRVRVDHEKGRDFLTANPYTIRRDFRLGPGRYSAKALVRVVGKDVTGFGRGQFEVVQ